jgi:methylglyoxal synthase
LPIGKSVFHFYGTLYNGGLDLKSIREDIPMANKKVAMEHDKKIALVAHDNKKRDLVEWARFNRDLLAHHRVYATGTTGKILEEALGFPIIKLQSGPLGGDQQVGAKIVDNEIDFLIFFWDPLEPQPHDPDVKALLRMAVVWNIPIACNRASADFMISSPLMDGEYDRLVTDYDFYRTRKIIGDTEPPMPDRPAAPPRDPDVTEMLASAAVIDA